MQGGIVDALWALELIAGRMRAVGVDFLLAGPVSLWLQGARGRVEKLYLLLVSSTEYNIGATRRALQVLSEPVGWPWEYEAIVEGRIVSVRLRDGSRVAAAADPVVEHRGGGRTRVVVRDYARSAGMVLVGGMIVRLARPGLDLLLQGEPVGPA